MATPRKNRAVWSLAATAALASRMIFRAAMTPGAAVPVDITLTVNFLFK